MYVLRNGGSRKLNNKYNWEIFNYDNAHAHTCLCHVLLTQLCVLIICASVYACVFRQLHTTFFSSTASSHGDIDSNFCLDASGRFYEGRGWSRRSRYISETTNGQHVAIMIFGDYDTNEPTLKTKAALRAFCACAVEQGYLRKDFVLMGHDQDVFIPPAYCPGQAMRRMIRRWPAP